MEVTAKNIIAGVTSVFTYFYGGWSILLTALLHLQVMDFVLGILASDEKINSKRLTQGGTKKGIMWMWILVANLVYMVLDHLGYELGVSIANFLYSIKLS